VSRRLPAVSVRRRRAVTVAEQRRCAVRRAPPAEAVGRVAEGRASAAYAGRARALRVGRADAAAWAKRRCASGPSVVSAERHSN
jgi:hypothetical protein